MGLVFHQHRDFARSSQLLREALDGPEPAALADGELHEALYAMARNDFWLGDYDAATAGFGALAERPYTAERTARALYQQGRSHELDGSWGDASTSYRRAYGADPTGSWAAAALISTMRIEWRTGAEEPALEAYDLLRTRRQWRGLAAARRSTWRPRTSSAVAPTAPAPG